MTLDARRFQRALETAPRSGPRGIGTLGEKTLHAVLKEYYRAPGAQKEVQVGPYVADLWDGTAATEIQTGGFARLDAKLAHWLPRHPVRVVCPLACTKWVVWLDTETGAATHKRRSPKKGLPAHALAELYPIRRHLLHPNFSLTVALLELLEYRSLNGWSADRKRGSTRYDRVPLALDAEVTVQSPEGWHRLVPPQLPQSFTAKDFRAVAGLRAGRGAWSALKVLEHTGVAVPAGKQGNAIRYHWPGAPD